jgi:flagellar protein FliS
MNPQKNLQAAQQYLRTRVMTATPEHLQMMLFDGAIRFGEAARSALSAQNFESSFKNISRMQRIVMELMGSLKHDVSPELCGKLGSIYKYVYKRLMIASMRRDPAALDEAVNLMRFQRESWAMLMQQLGSQKAAQHARNIPMPGPDERMEASISMSA